MVGSRAVYQRLKGSQICGGHHLARSAIPQKAVSTSHYVLQHLVNKGRAFNLFLRHRAISKAADPKPVPRVPKDPGCCRKTKGPCCSNRLFAVALF